MAHMGHGVPEKLQHLLHGRPAIWRAGEMLAETGEGIPTGYAELNKILPGHGWPGNAMVEIIARQWGIGELQLLLPMMKSVTEQQRCLIWVAPPYLPYAPALAAAGVDLRHVVMIRPDHGLTDTLWSIEQALQSGACGAVLAWLNWLPNAVVRRLQLAAERGNALGVLFRQCEVKNSPAALRLSLKPSVYGIHARILKARGTCRYRHIHLRLS